MIRSWLRSALAEKKEDPAAKEEARALCVLLGATPQSTLRETLVQCRQKAAGMQLDLGHARGDLNAARKQREERAAMIEKLTKKIVAVREYANAWSAISPARVIEILDANDEEIT